MLLPAQMTQRGGICSDSRRITYTPAVGRERRGTGPRKLLPRGGEGRRGEGGTAAGTRSHPGKSGTTPQPRTSPRKKMGKTVIKLPSPPERKERLFSPCTNANLECRFFFN